MNEGSIDRWVRGTLGVATVIFGYTLGPTSEQLLFYAVGAILLCTAVSGFCLLYRIIGFSTNKK
jgi:hypothetical protein